MEICGRDFTQQVLSQDQRMIGALPRRSYIVRRREVKEGNKGRRGRKFSQGRGVRKGICLPKKNLTTHTPGSF